MFITQLSLPASFQNLPLTVKLLCSTDPSSMSP